MLRGYIIEKEFELSLNRKRFKEVNLLFKDMINNLYGDVSPNSIIYAYCPAGKKKADLKVKINGVTKNFSIKTGAKNSVHLEHMNTFMDYMGSIGLNFFWKWRFKKYHYADGTSNGSGRKRLSVAEYKKGHSFDINCINSIINKDDMLLKSINRFIFDGRLGGTCDVILYGEPDDFLWVTKSEVVSYIKNNKFKSSAIHFGPLTIQPWTRNLNFTEKREYQRHYIQLKWYSLFDDIIQIMSRRDNK